MIEDVTKLRGLKDLLNVFSQRCTELASGDTIALIYEKIADGKLSDNQSSEAKNNAEKLKEWANWYEKMGCYSSERL